MKLSTHLGQKLSRKCLNSWRFFRAINIVFITIIALHCAAWVWSANRLVRLIDEQADNLRNQGWRIEIASARYGGWPGQARVEVGPATIAFHGLSVRAETLIAEAALVRSGPLMWRSRGHVLRFGSDPERTVLADDVAGTALPDGVVLTTAATRVAGLFEAEALQVQIGPNELKMTAQHLRPLAAYWTPGPTIAALDLRATALPPTSSDSKQRLAPASLHAAADHFDISLMRLSAARVDATGRAELWIDAALRPSLSGFVHVAGHAAALDGLAAKNVIAPRTAVAAKAVLGLLASPDGTVDIPVRIEGGILYAAQFPLLRLSTSAEPDLGPPH